MGAAKHIIWIGLLVLCLPHITAQNTDKDSIIVARGVIEGNDTILVIELPEVLVYNSQYYEYLYLKRRYRRLIRNVKKAYPYAKVAGVKLK